MSQVMQLPIAFVDLLHRQVQLYLSRDQINLRLTTLCADKPVGSHRSDQIHIDDANDECQPDPYGPVQAGQSSPPDGGDAAVESGLREAHAPQQLVRDKLYCATVLVDSLGGPGP